MPKTFFRSQDKSETSLIHFFLLRTAFNEFCIPVSDKASKICNNKETDGSNTYSTRTQYNLVSHMATLGQSRPTNYQVDILHVWIELRGLLRCFGSLASQRDNILPDRAWERPGLNDTALGGYDRTWGRFSLDSKADRESA